MTETKKKADGGQPPNRRVLSLTTRNPDPSGVAKSLDTRNKKLGDSSTVQPLMAYAHDAEEQRVPVEHKGHKEESDQDACCQSFNAHRYHSEIIRDHDAQSVNRIKEERKNCGF